jgi:hypothetical protein
VSTPGELTLEHLRAAAAFPLAAWEPKAGTRRRVVGAVRQYLRDPATGPADRVLLVTLAARLARANGQRVKGVLRPR